MCYVLVDEPFFLLQIGVCPLIDNRREDRYLYEVTVNTGSRRYAGTKSNVYLTISGNVSESYLTFDLDIKIS